MAYCRWPQYYDEVIRLATANCWARLATPLSEMRAFFLNRAEGWPMVDDECGDMSD